MYPTKKTDKFESAFILTGNGLTTLDSDIVTSVVTKSNTKFYPTNRNNPCPVCGDTTGDCRFQDIYIHCRDYVEAKKFDKIGDYKCTGHTKDGQWATFVHKDDDTYQANQQYSPEQAKIKAKKQADKLAQAKSKLENDFNESLPAGLRHIEYSRLLAELELHPDDRADLLARGFTESQIVLSGFKSVTRYQELTGEYHAKLPGINQKSNQIIAGESGYIIPVKDYDGFIVGLQLRVRNPSDGNRYRWISNKDYAVLQLAIHIDGLEPVLENPLAIFKPEKPESIWIVEGTGVKPFLTSQRLNAFVIGAAGGQFIQSQNQFKFAIERAITDYGQLPIRIAVDAGDIENTSVRNRWVELARHLQKLGHDFEFVWWNQVNKQNDSDIDELSSTELEKIEFITFEQFLNLKSNEIVFKSSQAFNERAFQEWDISRKFTATHKLNQKHFQISDDIPKSGAIIAGKAFMGSGKTHAQLQNIKANNDKGIYSYIISPRRKLNKQTIERAKNIGLTIYNLKDDNGLELLPGKQTNINSCAESFWKLDGYFQGMDICFDEIESMLPQILSGQTIKGKDLPLTLEIIKKAVQECSNVYLLDANLSDKTVNFFAELAKNKKVVKIDNLYKPAREKPVTIIDCINTKEEISIHDKSALVSLISVEQRPIIGTDSQTFAQTLSLLLAGQGKAGFVLDSISNDQTWTELFKRQPELEKYIELLNAKNIPVGSYWYEFLLANPDNFFTIFNPDYFIYTTTAESGVSIDLKGFFSCKTLVFFGVIATNNQLQMSGRLRDDSIPMYVYCPERSVIPRSSDFNQQREESLVIAVRQAFKALSDDLDVTPSDVFKLANERTKNIDEFWKLGNQLKALENFEKSNLRACLIYRLEQMDYTVEIKQAESVKAYKDELKEKKEIVLNTEALEIFNSVAYETVDDAEKANKKSDSIKVKRAVKKTKILFSNPGIEQTKSWSVEYIHDCFVKDRNWRYNLDKFYLLFNPEISAKKSDYERYFKFTSQHVNKQQIIKDLELTLKGLRNLKIDELITELVNGLQIHKDSERIQQIVNIARGKKIFGFNPKPESVDRKENIEFIKSCLSKVGLKLKHTSSIVEDKVKRYFHGLDLEDFNSEYRKDTLECIARYHEQWLVEKYNENTPDWEYSKNNNGERPPNNQDSQVSEQVQPVEQIKGNEQINDEIREGKTKAIALDVHNNSKSIDSINFDSVIQKEATRFICSLLIQDKITEKINTDKLDETISDYLAECAFCQ
ncbi:hypothetical protein A6769_37280 [Nostoc punctiforme NIES-2108]|uniref:Replication origin-binding protein domain-containing protein n=1 Tax=Nostoc punctiforme NIES-2108 TaxID=1356359 RepID=A0A367S158_NOSPU|nr:hypothetical protein A6769_37280 [Nostoc punctiforme NIES-2108]